MIKTITAGVHWVLEGRSGVAATIQTLVTRLLVIATSLLTGVITARLLGAEGRGELAAILTWPQFLSYALTLGIPYALIFNLKKHPEDESKIFSASLYLGLILGAVAASIGIVFMPQWLAKYSPDVIRLAQWLMLTAPLVLLSTITTKTLEARSEFRIANQTNYLQTLLTLLVLVLLALLHALTPWTAALTYSLTWLPLTGWMLAHLLKSYQLSVWGLGKYFKELLSYGLRSYGIDLISTLSGQIGQALVVGLLIPKELGLYAVALSVSRMLGVFQGSIVTVLLPKVSACPVEQVITVTGRAARLSGALTGLAAIVVILVCPLLLQVIYGAEFLEAASVLRILVIEAAVGSTAWVLAQAFMGLGRPGVVTVLQGVGLALNVPLLIFLIPRFGINGAGLALLGTTLFRMGFVLVCFPFILKVPSPGLLINKEDVQFLRQKLRKS